MEKDEFYFRIRVPVDQIGNAVAKLNELHSLIGDLEAEDSDGFVSVEARIPKENVSEARNFFRSLGTAKLLPRD